MRMPDDPRPDTVPSHRIYGLLAGFALLGDEAAAQRIKEIDERAASKNTKPKQPQGGEQKEKK